MAEDQRNTSDQSTDPTVGGWVLVEHRVIVDGQEIYRGDELHIASQLFIQHVHDPRFMEVSHEVHKQIIPYALADPTYQTDLWRKPKKR
jgi:hypothetical protein